jgi:GntR family transcriptional regulator
MYSFNGDTPLYKQIADYIRFKIDSGEWPIGSQVPTEQQLCNMFNVSRITVVKALDRLVQEGLLFKEQGKGTFVAEPQLTYGQKELMSFTEEALRKGKVPGIKILKIVQEYPPVGTIQLLKLNKDEMVWVLQRLMLEDDHPIGVQTSYLPIKFFKNLQDKISDNTSLYKILQEEYGTYIDHASGSSVGSRGTKVIKNRT